MKVRTKSSSVAAMPGAPVLISVDDIDEDPLQPRTESNPGFSSKSLAELARAIALRGVKTPISLRPHPTLKGRYLINHGARRYRAARLAGLLRIPSFIDADYSLADQVVENLHRNELTAREIADYIGHELARGLRKGDIARLLSKSAAFVTQHAALLDLPEAIAEVFAQGRVRDVTVINELVALYRRSARDVEVWLADGAQEVTRGTVRVLKAFIEQRAVQASTAYKAESGRPIVTLARSSLLELESPSPMDATWKSPVLLVKHNGRMARLLLRRRPSSPERAWLRYEDVNALIEVALQDVQLVALIEG